MKTENSDKQKLINTALILSLITIFYNIAEGLVSVFLGYTDETLSLLGFGLDSFIEVISGIGILHMVLKIKRSEIQDSDRFEKNALRITGVSFLILSAGLVIGAVISIINKTRPETTIPGIIISAISILTMYALMKVKLSTGRKLGSDAIIADAKCTMTCLYLSFILLGASVIYAIFRIGYIDIIGSIGIAYFSFREGREALEKAKNNGACCSSC
jgi:divalent metal cation (Fe/Co/Zn/Cd) transporter